MKDVELLAPAGSWEALKAAVQNGADAVYLGGRMFSARQYANNFDEKALEEAVKYCHIRDVKVFVTINTLMRNDEIKELSKYIGFLYNIDVDAVIVQDLGAVRVIKALFPDWHIHASTQMSVHNLEGTKFLEEMGIKRVVLAREMSKEAIHNIKKNTGIDIEIFVHGALCISYSGQCLMSSMIGGRSGNRGRCAQPCRMPYSLVDLEYESEIKHDFGDYLLSPRDLNTIQNLNEIVAAGVDSLKLEGRMKRSEYVAVVVHAYRKALDICLNNIKSPLEEDMLKDLEQIFNRGFTKGYLFGEKGREWMNFSKPNNRGIKVGKVIAYERKKHIMSMRLDDILSKGDGIEVNSGDGQSYGSIIHKILLKGKEVEYAEKGDTIEVFLKGPVKINSSVYKTSDIDLLNRACSSYQKENKKIPIYGQFYGEAAKAIELLIWDDRGNFVQEVGDFVPIKAKQTPTSEKIIREQLEKMGNTPYIWDDLEIKWDDGLLIPIGKLNKLRRDAVKQLDRLRSNLYNRKPVNIDKISIEMPESTHKRIEERRDIQLRIQIQTMKQLHAVLKFPVDRIYYGDMGTVKEACELAQKHNIELFPALPRIIEDDQFAFMDEQMKSWEDINGILVSDLGMFNLVRQNYVFEMVTDFSLNVFNNHTIELLHGLGARETTLSPELTLNQIEEIIQNGQLPCETIVHGYIPMMIMKYCPISGVLGSDNTVEECNICKSKKFGLRDRKGMIFPILAGENCKVEILNSRKLCMVQHIDELFKSGIKNLRIRFTIEGENEIIYTLRAYIETIEAVLAKRKADGSKIQPLIDMMGKSGYTKGHFFRGVE